MIHNILMYIELVMLQVLNNTKIFILLHVMIKTYIERMEKIIVILNFDEDL